jgi:hypothetical protein
MAKYGQNNRQEYPFLGAIPDPATRKASGMALEKRDQIRTQKHNAAVTKNIRDKYLSERQNVIRPVVANNPYVPNFLKPPIPDYTRVFDQLTAIRTPRTEHYRLGRGSPVDQPVKNYVPITRHSRLGRGKPAGQPTKSYDPREEHYRGGRSKPAGMPAKNYVPGSDVTTFDTPVGYKYVNPPRGEGARGGDQVKVGVTRFGIYGPTEAEYIEAARKAAEVEARLNVFTEGGKSAGRTLPQQTKKEEEIAETGKKIALFGSGASDMSELLEEAVPAPEALIEDRYQPIIDRRPFGTTQTEGEPRTDFSGINTLDGIRALSPEAQAEFWAERGIRTTGTPYIETPEKIDTQWYQGADGQPYQRLTRSQFDRARGVSRKDAMAISQAMGDGGRRQIETDTPSDIAPQKQAPIDPSERLAKIERLKNSIRPLPLEAWLQEHRRPRGWGGHNDKSVDTPFEVPPGDFPAGPKEDTKADKAWQVAWTSKYEGPIREEIKRLEKEYENSVYNQRQATQATTATESRIASQEFTAAQSELKRLQEQARWLTEALYLNSTNQAPLIDTVRTSYQSILGKIFARMDELQAPRDLNTSIPAPLPDTGDDLARKRIANFQATTFTPRQREEHAQRWRNNDDIREQAYNISPILHAFFENEYSNNQQATPSSILRHYNTQQGF